MRFRYVSHQRADTCSSTLCEKMRESTADTFHPAKTEWDSRRTCRPQSRDDKLVANPTAGATPTLSMKRAVVITSVSLSRSSWKVLSLALSSPSRRRQCRAHQCFRRTQQHVFLDDVRLESKACAVQTNIEITVPVEHVRLTSDLKSSSWSTGLDVVDFHATQAL